LFFLQALWLNPSLKAAKRRCVLRNEASFIIACFFLTAGFLDGFRDYCGHFSAPALNIRNLSVGKGKKGVIPSAAHIWPGMDAGSPLTNKNGTCSNYASAVYFYAKIFWV
jgi:hypothetical protein